MRYLCSLSLFVMTAAMAGKTVAQEAPAAGAPAWQKACDPDIRKHCMDAAKAGKVTECLASHESELTEECTRVFLVRYKVMQACKEDIEGLCQETVAAGGSLGKCFKDNNAKLSEKCRKALSKGSKQARTEEKAAKSEPPAAAEEPAEKKPAKKKK